MKDKSGNISVHILMCNMQRCNCLLHFLLAYKCRGGGRTHIQQAKSLDVYMKDEIRMKVYTRSRVGVKWCIVGSV